MTGEKDRYKTHEQLWKLEDGELSTPKHDEMVLQLMNPRIALNLLKIIGYDEKCWLSEIVNMYPKNYEHVYGRSSGYPVNYGSECCPDIKKEFDLFLQSAHSSLHGLGEEIFKEFLIKGYDPRIEIGCEVPIHSGQNKFIIGYLDIRYNVGALYKSFPIEPNELYEFHDDWYKSSESGIITVIPRGKLEVVNPSLSYDVSDIVINIEVKPKIKSFGETLRQINTYRACVKGTFVIYSPDTRFKAAFESQGVKFITPSDLGIKM